MQRLKTLVDRLGSGPYLVGRLESGVRVSAIFQIFPLDCCQFLPHSNIRIHICILQISTSTHPHYTPANIRSNADISDARCIVA